MVKVNWFLLKHLEGAPETIGFGMFLHLKHATKRWVLGLPKSSKHMEGTPPNYCRCNEQNDNEGLLSGKSKV